MMANELTVLRSRDFELVLHPSDLVIRGKEADVVHVRALLAEHLVFSKAYLTWTKEANELEDRITSIHQETAKHDNHTPYREVMGRLNKLAEDVRKVKLSYDEWEVLCASGCYWSSGYCARLSSPRRN